MATGMVGTSRCVPGGNIASRGAASTHLFQLYRDGRVAKIEYDKIDGETASSAARKLLGDTWRARLS
jgi:hypothetical protein